MSIGDFLSGLLGDARQRHPVPYREPVPGPTRPSPRSTTFAFGIRAISPDGLDEFLVENPQAVAAPEALVMLKQAHADPGFIAEVTDAVRKMYWQKPQCYVFVVFRT